MVEDEELPSDWFWSLIATGGHDSERMAGVLSQLTRTDLERFHNEFSEAVTAISWDDYCNVHGYGESKMRDLASWIVSQGKAFFAMVYDDPKRIPRFDEVDHSRSYIGIAEQVYSARFAQDIPWGGA